VRVALDTNVLVYAAGVNGFPRKMAALGLLRKLSVENTVLPAQTLSELYNVLVRKAAQSRAEARLTVLGWIDTFPVAETSPAVAAAAIGLATDHRLGIWDAVILAASAQAGCRLLLSEDLQDGFTWSGLTVTNPFSSSPHALLSALLDG
jgi:predicted nucleic acid-binding protein